MHGRAESVQKNNTKSEETFGKNSTSAAGDGVRSREQSSALGVEDAKLGFAGL